MIGAKTSYRTCPLCEATCGLEIITRGREVVSIRGDRDDVLSHGYICPKGFSLKELDADPDRLREPIVRHGDRWRAVGWDEAFAEIDRRLSPILERQGRDALAFYVGNPSVHNLSGLIYVPALLRTLRTRNLFTAGTVDQIPKQVAAGLMFGTMWSIPVPDVDRTEHLLMLGANPLVSNGSLLAAPDMRGRLRRLRARGGKLVVVDPRRSRTAEEADEHHFIRPGTDAHLLFAIVHTLFAEGLVAPGRLTEHTSGVDRIQELARAFSPEVVASVCGIRSHAIRSMARELARARRAAVYGRTGTCTQEFGTLTSWLVDALNVLTGNLDREGGVMFPKPAAGSRNTVGVSGQGSGVRLGRWKSRVRGLPEMYGELPVSCLAEEIDTSGPGQVRALITIAGNPVLSTPNAGRLQQALSQLEFMVSVDIYLNETTRYAHVILPTPSPLSRPHFDLLFAQLSVRNVTNYSSPVFELEPGQLGEWEILLRLMGILTGQGPNADPARIDDGIMLQLIQREVETPRSRVGDRDPRELLAALQPRRGPDRVLDFMLRAGPYGEGWGQNPGGLRLDVLEANPHGIDLGALEPRVPEILRTPSGKIELAPEPIVADVERLRRSLDRVNGSLVLVGRRHLRSNNSWMHNLNVLVKGRDNRSTLEMHPDDAAKLGVTHGETARVSSRAGSVDVPVEVTDAVMPGVVSLPHGWGHGQPGVGMRVASAHPGVNSNLLADEVAVDQPSGTAVLNGIPVTVEKVNPQDVAAQAGREQDRREAGAALR